MADRESVVVLLSGGVNSLVAGMRLLSVNDLHLLHVDYGQASAHSERNAARRIAQSLALPLSTVEVALNEAEPGGGAEAGADTQRRAAQAMRKPPGMMLSLFGAALDFATRLGAVSIVCGVSQCCDEADLRATRGQGDPQSQRLFLHSLQTSIELSMPSKRRIDLDFPFLDMARCDVVRLGMRLGAPFQFCWSCLIGDNAPCGQCRGCVSSTEAFAEVGMVVDAGQVVSR